MKNLGFFLISFLLMILLVSCNTFKVREQTTSIDDSITHYNVALRWAMYKEAYSYHYSPDGKQPPAKLDNLEQINLILLILFIIFSLISSNSGIIPFLKIERSIL